ncbi:hypothetical protein CEP53_010127 [Fusarium sp. AF-6]|nr:hypothetical protein CEP53_010127 [Fusarium sp. AF-6]
MPGPGDYTVGWICAVETEYVAARAFLDEIHPGPTALSRHDDNSYTLGKIGGHLVVMAVGPDGERGPNVATTVARNMMHSFPNIRIGLLVGTGGGVPSPRHDIRLGDVVVSSPRNAIGGVLQYDFGKSIQNQTFLMIGILDQPPTLLRTTVTHLKSVYQAEGHRIEETVAQVLSTKPRLQAAFGRPNPTTDRLFQSGFAHPADDKLSCTRHCASDPRRLVNRPPRRREEDNPAIHFGLIASAGNPMRNAMLRDHLAREKDILCFETEAAGLMNHFPCLVVRGICDYSDSHRTREWQGYASMTAAAYAKDLLLNIIPTRIRAEKKILEVVVTASVEDTKVNTERTIVHLDREQDNEILDWVTPFDYAPVQREHFSKSLTGTCQLFLGSNEFHQWVDTIIQTLFCGGIPGAGKTVMTSIVVNSLQQRFRDEPTVGLAYIYCDHRRQKEQTLDHMFAAILKQLAQRYSVYSGLPEAVRALYDQHLRTQGITKPRTQPLLAEVLECLPLVTDLFSKVYIVVDALDELQALGGRRSKFLKNLLALQRCTGFNLLVTSRHIPDIQRQFTKTVFCEIAANEEDVQSYVDDQLQYMQDFVQDDPKLQNEIRRAISEAHGGMFRVAAAHLTTLAEQPTVGDLELVLLDIPRSFCDIYSRSTDRIDQQSTAFRKLAKKVLACIAFARRPVGALELQRAIAARPGAPELDERFFPSVDTMVSVSEGLLSYDPESRELSLAHHTLQGYLERQAAMTGWFQDDRENVTDSFIASFSFGDSRSWGFDAVA